MRVSWQYRLELILVLALSSVAGHLRAQVRASSPGASSGDRAAVDTTQPLDARTANDVQELYRATLFSDCVAAARRLLDPHNPNRVKDSKAIDNTRTYLAACLILTGDVKGGEQVFEEGIRAGMQVEPRRLFPRPSPYVFPKDIVDHFDRVFQRLDAEFRVPIDAKLAEQRAQQAARLAAEQRERERVARLYALASEESVVVMNRRWVALVPFGVGQFQNRKPGLGWLFLTTEGLALGTTIGAVLWDQMLKRNRPLVNPGSTDSEQSVNAEAWHARDRGAYLLFLSSVNTFGALAVLGVLEAQLNFVPEFRQKRPRALPKELEPERARPRARETSWRGVVWGPSLSPLPGGGQVGVRARF